MREEDYIHFHIKRINRNIMLVLAILIALLLFLINMGGIKLLTMIPSNISFKQIRNDIENISIFLGVLEYAIPTILLIVVTAVFSVTVMIFIKFIKQIFNVKNHPLYKSISYYGQYDLFKHKINSEVRHKGNLIYANIIITENWLLQSMFFKVNILKTEDIVYAYEAVSNHKEGLLAPGIAIAPTEVGKSYCAIILTKNALIPTITINILHEFDVTDSDDVNTEKEMKKRSIIIGILKYLKEKTPNAKFNYTED